MSLVSFTAFPSLERDLAQTVREAALDHESLQTPIRACELNRCRGMCCHDGVFVGREERGVIGDLFPGEVFEMRGQKMKTRTVVARQDELGEGYPKHFPQTRCVFLDENHYCRLQSQAVEEGMHPWYWKPFPCWLHPLGFQREALTGRPILSLPTEKKDPAGEPGYPGFASCTTCGKLDLQGTPAWKTLEPELRFLSQISGRDLLGELSC